MNPRFQRLMHEATRLTRFGNLKAATAAIQSALARAPAEPPPGAHEGDVIDAEVRELPEHPALAPGTPVAPQAAPRVAPDVVPHAPVPAVDEQPAPPARVRDEAFIAGRFGSGTSARDYKLYVPPHTEGRSLPLVVMLHGCTQNPDDFAAGTGMNDAARDEGCFVLYPAQSSQANPQRCWNWFKHSHQERGRGEPAIIAAMTQDVVARHAIDPSRVYVAGLSAGGAMAAIVAQAYPDVFAAAGVHSGLPQGSARDLPSALQAMKAGSMGAAPQARTPVIVFHGDADGTVHPRNGSNLFAAAGGSGQAHTETGAVTGGRSWTRRVRTAADGAPVAEYWEVHGAPHAWSGGTPRGSYTDPLGPDATREMLRFFRSHALPAAQGGTIAP